MSDNDEEVFDFSRLSERHAHVAFSIMEGMSAAHVAQRGPLTANEVARLREQVYAKAGVATKAELVHAYTRYRWKVALDALNEFIDQHGHSIVPEPDHLEAHRMLWSNVRQMRQYHAWLQDPESIPKGAGDPFPGIDWERELGAMPHWEWESP